MSTTFAVNGRPVTVDDFQSTSVAVQNTGTVPLLIEPLGRQVAVGATVTVPGWSARRTRVRTAGLDGTAVVTLTAGSPAAGPGPGGVTFDPGPAASMSLSIAGGTWYTNEGLTSAVSFPLTVTAATVLYPAAPASVVITATVGTAAQVRGMNVVDGSTEAFTWTPTTDVERAAADVSAGNGAFARFSVTQGALYVDPVSGSDSANDGLSPGGARRTIQGALNALPATGGNLELAAGTYAESVLIDSSVIDRRGIRIRGKGAWATIITPASGDGIKLASNASRSIQMVDVQDLAVVSAPGNGFNLGGADWVQIGNVTFRNVRVESCGGHGVLAHDVNEVTFDNVRSRSNAGCGFYFSSKSGDQGAVDPVSTGNTWVLRNCGTYGNTGDGIQLNQVGNSVTIIGGELHDSTASGAYGLNVVPGASTRGVNLLGVHFEHNWRGAHLGDNAANGFSATGVTFTGCTFLQQTDGNDVFLDGSDGTIFSNCQFGGSTAGITVSNTTSNRYYLKGTCLGTSSTKLLKQRNGTVWDKVSGMFSWGGRLRLINDSSGFADSVSTALVYLQNNQSTAKMIEMNDAAGSVFIHAGSGSPETVVTAGIGSLYLRRDGGAATCLYIKESGTGNTGWVAK